MNAFKSSFEVTRKPGNLMQRVSVFGDKRMEGAVLLVAMTLLYLNLLNLTDLEKLGP